MLGGHPNKQRVDSAVFVRLTGTQHKAHQIAQSVDERHDLGRQIAAGDADRLTSDPPFCPLTMPVEPHDRTVDHRVFEIAIL